jgi:serine/threonine-protein kinase
MAPEGWLRLRELFAAAVLLAPTERASLLDRECGGDADLRREVESLLRHDPGPETGANGDETAFDPNAAGRREAEPAAVGDRVGNIRIVEVLGAGGMGKVYVGYDETLQRKVALKAIGGRHRLRPEARARFLREARILSQLEHSNICRIYDYLVHGDSELLVLELIDGPTLSKAADDGLSFQRQLEIAGKIAEVLAAAHGAGIIHRDLKPDNVMLTRSGEVKVLDFGLALAVETEPGEGDPAPPQDVRAMVDPPPPNGAGAAADSDDRTLTFPGGTPAPAAGGDAASRFSLALRTEAGRVMGTPLYMSPEQARGEVVTTASDMYSFGLLLQALFTGKSPYPEGLGARQILDRARRGETLPVAGIDRDVAALVGQLKSVAPAARPTAVAALERLRWIRDKPKRRLRRLIAAAVVVAVVLAGLKYTFDLRRERSAAVAARKVAEQRRLQAEDLIGFMLGDLRRRLEPVGRLEILDDVGEKAMAYFAAVPDGELSDDELARRSMALYQIGEVRIAQGRLAAAQAPLEKSLALARALAERDPDNGERLFGLGQSHFWVGYVRWKKGDLDGSIGPMRAYLEISEALATREPENLDWRLELAYAHSNLGSILEARGDLEGALEKFERTLAIEQELVERDPANLDWRFELAQSHNTVGVVLQKQGRFSAARGHFETEIEIKRSLVEKDPAHARWRLRLGLGHYFLGRLQALTGEWREARQSQEVATEILERLSAEDPANTDWQFSLNSARLELGRILRELGDLEGAWTQAMSFETSSMRLSWSDSSSAAARRLAAAGEILSAKILNDRQEREPALRRARRAVNILEAIVEDNPTEVESPQLLGEGWALIGVVETRRGRDAQAMASWARAVEILTPLIDDAQCFGCLVPQIKALLYSGRIEEAKPYVDQFSERGHPDTEMLMLFRNRALGENDTNRHTKEGA